MQLTVGKNGKVKEKLTKVHANHIAGYVAPAFIAATKEMRIDRSLLTGMTGKDTSLLLTFPMEYQCVLDTINKARPEEDLNEVMGMPFNRVNSYLGGNIPSPMNVKQRERELANAIASYPSYMNTKYLEAEPTRVWYYLAFIQGQPE